MDEANDTNEQHVTTDESRKDSRGPGRLGFTVLSIIAVIAIAIAAWFVFSEMREKAAVRTAVASADKHYASAIGVVADIEPRLTRVSLADRDAIASDVTSLTATLDDELGRATREVELSRAAIGGVEDAGARAAYERALDDLTSGLGSLASMIRYLGSSAAVLQQLVDATQSFTAGDKLMNDAVAAANKRQWTFAQSRAKAAIVKFKTAEAMFADGAKSNPESGLSAAVTYAARYRADAELVLRMAAAGTKSDPIIYNRLSTQLNSSRAVTARLAEPAALTDPSWTQKRLDEYGTEVKKRMADADRAMAEARRSIDSIAGRP